MDVYDRIHDLLISQWKDSENLNGIIEMRKTQARRIDSALQELVSEFELDNAEGVVLDIIGRVIGITRRGRGRGDAEFREFIRNSQAQFEFITINQLVQVLKQSFGATRALYFPEYPAGYVVDTDADITQEELDNLNIAGVTGFLGGRILFGDLASSIFSDLDHWVTQGGTITSPILAQNNALILAQDGSELHFISNRLASNSIYHV